MRVLLMAIVIIYIILGLDLAILYKSEINCKEIAGGIIEMCKQRGNAGIKVKAVVAAPALLSMIVGIAVLSIIEMTIKLKNRVVYRIWNYTEGTYDETSKGKENKN